VSLAGRVLQLARSVEWCAVAAVLLIGTHMLSYLSLLLVKLTVTQDRHLKLPADEEQVHEK
jgi:hypothetical protein